MTDLKKPIRKDDAFLDDVQRNRNKPGYRLWWLGQSGFLLQFAGEHLLLDPYLSDSLTKKYADTDKPHVRMTEQIVAPGRLDFIDAATSTHNHTDHLDAETLGPLLRVNPGMKLIIPEANRAFVAERLQIDPDAPLGLDAGGSVTVGAFEVHAVPAAHERLDRDAGGRLTHLGYVVRFGDHAVYHSGDTVRYHGMAETLGPFGIDAAILPINGRAPERRVAGNLWGREAAQLAAEIGAGVVIPCHYDMFAFNTATPEEFVAACDKLGQRHAVLENGGRFDGGTA